jgi:CubicO group peptidase (beta-lactamase class C family)
VTPRPALLAFLLTACGAPQASKSGTAIVARGAADQGANLGSPPVRSSVPRETPATADGAFRDPEGTGPRHFLLLGPLPGSASALKRGRPSIDRDYFAALGGEAQARLRAGVTLSIDGRPYTAREGALDDKSTLDLAATFGPGVDDKTAYAYAEWSVAAESTVLAVFGSDDGATVWVNGRLAHRLNVERPLDPAQDRFPVRLQAGVNRLLIKVDNHSGGWGFALRLLDAADAERLRRAEVRRHLEIIRAAPADGNYLIRDSLPAIAWSSPADAQRVMKGPPAVRWFAPDFEPIGPDQYPTDDGQYSAAVEGTTLDGRIVRQMVSFAKVPSGVVPSFPSPPTRELPPIDFPWPFDTPLDDAQRAELSRHFWRGAFDALREGPDAAVAALAMARLAEGRPSAREPSWLGGGFIQVAEHELALRRTLEGRAAVPLAPPAALASPAPKLRAGSEAEAEMQPGTVGRLRAVAVDWGRADPHPFVVLVARHGVVVFHQGFNGWSKDSGFFPASLGKTMAALTFARAVDQGLLALDQRVGTVLPDWNIGPAASVTFRQCFDHVTGLAGHASHGGMFNAYLDNALAVQDEAFASPGTRYRYNGDDVDLVGKALELTTGQSIWRLLYENMEKPFDEPVDQLDLGFGDSFTAMYLAKVGQMILQDGRYGPYAFFKSGFLSSLLPRRIAEFVPDLDDKTIESGVGFFWMTDPPGPRDGGLLGPNVIGHGASSGAVWRVDPDHGVIIVVGRNGFADGPTNQMWTTKLVGVVAAALGSK